MARRYTRIPRSGDQVYGFVAGLYPTDAPTLLCRRHHRAGQPYAPQPLAVVPERLSA